MRFSQQLSLVITHTALLFIFCLFPSQNLYAKNDLTAVSIQLSWRHQFEYAGYYAAIHKGFYQSEGLQVTLKEGGPNISPINEVVEKKQAQFGISSSALVKPFVEGKPVLMLAPIMQHSPEVLITKAGLVTPTAVVEAGLLGLQPGDEDLDFKAMFVNEGIKLDKLKIDEGAGNLQNFIDGRVVAFGAYRSNEPFLLEKMGKTYSVINPANYGLDFYQDVLFTHSEFYQQHPKVVDAFYRATMKGWRYALTHEQEMIGLILAQYNSQSKTRAHLQYEATVLNELISPNLVELGHSNPWRWQRIAETYANFGVINADFDLTKFAYEANPPPKDLTWLYRALALTLGLLALIAAVLFYIFKVNRRLKRANLAVENAYEEQHQFIDMLTHELKTPISVASMAMEGVKGEAKVKKRVGRALSDMQGVVERCQQLDLLTREAVVAIIEPCVLNQLITNAKNATILPERIKINNTDAITVNTDPQLLYIILTNLLNNAINFSSQASEIDVHISQVQSMGKAGIQIEVFNTPGEAGLPEEALLFDKYYRSKGAQKQTGSGLGLYLVKNFTKLIGGTIGFDVVQERVRFTLWIPS